MHDPYQYDNEDDGKKDGEGGEETGEGSGFGINIQRICSIRVRSFSVFSHQMHDVVAGIRGTETVKAEHMSGLGWSWHGKAMGLVGTGTGVPQPWKRLDGTGAEVPRES